MTARVGSRVIARSRGAAVPAVAAVAALGAVPACAADPVAGAHPSFVVEPIDRTVVFDGPVPARLYVDYRAVSYPGRTVEYGVEIEGEPRVVAYAIVPSSPRPLQTRIYDGRTGALLLALVADDRTLEISGDGVATLVVDGYTAPTAGRVVAAVMPLAARLRPLLDAVLPARSELAPVPGFWQNLDQPAAPDGDIGHTTSSGRPLLGDWSADVSLLGALFLQSPCLGDTGYRCPCLRVDTPAVGEVDTCPSAKERP